MADQKQRNERDSEIQRCTDAMRRLETESVEDAGADWATVREVRDGLLEAKILRRERAA